MSMTQRYAGMLRRQAGDWDKRDMPVQAECARQAARHMEELQSRADRTREALDMLAGLHPGLTVDTDQPMAMAGAIFESVQAEIRQWREEAEKSRAMLVSFHAERAELARHKLAQAQGGSHA